MIYGILGISPAWTSPYRILWDNATPKIQMMSDLFWWKITVDIPLYTLYRHPNTETKKKLDPQNIPLTPSQNVFGCLGTGKNHQTPPIFVVVHEALKGHATTEGKAWRRCRTWWWASEQRGTTSTRAVSLGHELVIRCFDGLWRTSWWSGMHGPWKITLAFACFCRNWGRIWEGTRH